MMIDLVGTAHDIHARHPGVLRVRQAAAQHTTPNDTTAPHDTRLLRTVTRQRTVGLAWWRKYGVGCASMHAKPRGGAGRGGAGLLGVGYLLVYRTSHRLLYSLGGAD